MCGVSGTGKTTFFVNLLKKEKARWKFVYDHQGELGQRLGVKPVFDLESLCKATERGGIVCFDPSSMFPEDFQKGAVFFFDYVLKISETFKGRKLIICDEWQEMFFREHPPEVATVFNIGRRLEIDIYFICQSPNQLHPLCRNQITEVWTFRQGDENATEFLEKQGLDREKILSLPEFHWLYKNCRTGATDSGGGKVQAQSA